ncbi:MAG: peptide chain release factor N(5)-glutamine methyltransferase [Clostridia bacterium]|nr:peptide chain release factor N(5)-glutamine methyltransferase [Clostridia bacterium]
MVSEEAKTVREALLWAASCLREKGIENARLEAEVLLSKILGMNRGKLLASLGDPLEKGEFLRFRELVAKRQKGYPLQYITGEQEFMSMNFLVEEGVFIPRGDTEVLVEAVLGLGEKFENILDVGTGSGIIAVILAKYFPQSRVTAVDISPRALETAAKNAEGHGVKDRINFTQNDIFLWQPGEQYDLIVSNPPYVPSGDIDRLQREISFEPREALDGGYEGLRFYYRLSELALECLLPGGVLAVEIGWDQAAGVRRIFDGAGIFDKEIQVVRDYGGRDRVVVCRKSVKNAGGSG